MSDQIIMTVYIQVTCPECNSTDIVRNGKTHQGKQRYICRNSECSRRTFILNYTNNGYKPEVKQKISEMAVNGSGIRDTARVLKISASTVMSELKKKNHQ
jgi:insertion element IS1 protein InsB